MNPPRGKPRGIQREIRLWIPPQSGGVFTNFIFSPTKIKLISILLLAS